MNDIYESAAFPPTSDDVRALQAVKSLICAHPGISARLVQLRSNHTKAETLIVISLSGDEPLRELRIRVSDVTFS